MFMASDITEGNDIRRLLACFYEAAGNDDLIGPIFAQLASSEADREELYRYWEATLLDSKDHDQHLFPVHIQFMERPQHFIRWLSLFQDTIDRLFAGPNAERAKIAVFRKSEEFQATLVMFRF
jgi:hemoglobin